MNTAELQILNIYMFSLLNYINGDIFASTLFPTVFFSTATRVTWFYDQNISRIRVQRELNTCRTFWPAFSYQKNWTVESFCDEKLAEVQKDAITTVLIAMQKQPDPLLISTSFLKYPLELKKKKSVRTEKKIQLVYNWIFFFSSRAVLL